MQRFRIYLCLVLALFFSLGLTAQGWEQVYGGTARDAAKDVLASPDGGFYVLGNTASYGNGDQDVYLIKTNPDGEEEWSTNIGDSLWAEYGNSIQYTADGNLIIGGNAFNTSTKNSNFYIVKTDLQGNVLWEQRSDSSGIAARSIVELPSGEFMLCGSRLFERTNTNGGMDTDSDIYLVKFDANGQEITPPNPFQYGGTKYEDAYAILNGDAGEVIVMGYTRSYGAGEYDVYLAAINTTTAELVRETTYGDTTVEIGHGFAATNDGGYVITGQQNLQDGNHENFFLLKVDSDWEQEWFQSYPLTGLEKARAVTPTSTGYILVGEYRYSTQHDRDPFILQTDFNGTYIRSANYGGLFEDVAVAVDLAADRSIVIAGHTFSYGEGSSDAYLLKIDSTGHTYNNLVYGNVYTDFDLDCETDPTDVGIPEWLIKATGSISRNAFTDSLGNYQMRLDTGAYLIQPVPPSSYWTPCNDNYPITISGSFDTIAVDIPVQPEVDCPLLYVNLSTPFLRRCFQNNYTVRYCNNGTALAEDAYIDIHFDQYFTIDTASIPYTQNGTTFTFQVGDLDIFDCGQFQIYTTLNCDSTVTGQTHCVEAHIYPDSICQPIDPSWDGSSIDVDATCQGDSVSFQISNVGTGDMQQVNGYVIIEDHIVLLTGDFHLLAQQDTTIRVPSNGGSFRMDAGQSQGHPGLNEPSIILEGCGGNPFSQGYAIELPQNDGNPFIDIDCQESIGSYDPNDKIAFPKGFDDAHYLTPNTDLEYLIRFQNTGSDTAFRVVLRDTLSPFLDLSSVQVGVGSHPYTFKIYGEGILQFTFDNILLPDSSTNELASHGFIKFRVSQKPDNPLGTYIYNSAGIYFDYNEPVITNQTFHLIGENFVYRLETTGLNPDLTAPEIKYYPNPFSDHITFELSNIQQAAPKSFSLYDLQGRLLHRAYFTDATFTFERAQLAKGLYLFRIEQEGLLIGNGKLMIGQ